eukprot:CAMPEP_0197606020 /NCGR_PEP_ID=MMETSP1326-20131121/44214_1 /TAXON_ID=1155430 /ORGANISM="Genus nov. species nov., Strain RCC2288" /LENGTH=243 /DNA_ID=CAMNT_0043173873 /DNA_START=84 /DNA_END=811 /DNA_ORIENTATION=-
MKYIEVPALGLLAAVVSGRQNGVSRVCRIDKYLAGKVARRNRASAKQIEDRILKHLEEQPDSPELTFSALGDMHLQASRKLLADLISTLNSASPDLTFDGVSPADFVRAGSLMSVAQAVNERLADVDGSSLLTTLWSSIDRAVGLKECDIFTFVGDQPDEEEATPNLWTFNYFFVNRSRKEIVYFSCSCAPAAPVTEADLTRAEEAAVGVAGGGVDPGVAGKLAARVLGPSQDDEDATWDMEG